MALWEVAEYVGEMLVLIGVVGEVYAGWGEYENKTLEKKSSVVLVVGLALSLAALVGTNEGFNSTIADLNLKAAQSTKDAGQAALDAATAHKETAQLQNETQTLKTEEENAKRDMVAAQLELARLTGPVHVVPFIHGTATPDLSKSLIQRILLTTDTRIKTPVLPPLDKEGNVAWTLFLDEDGVGLHRYAFEFMNDVEPRPGLLPNSRASFDFVTDTHGRTTMRGIPIINMPIITKHQTK